MSLEASPMPLPKGAPAAMTKALEPIGIACTLARFAEHLLGEVSAARVRNIVRSLYRDHTLAEIWEWARWVPAPEWAWRWERGVTVMQRFHGHLPNAAELSTKLEDLPAPLRALFGTCPPQPSP